MRRILLLFTAAAMTAVLFAMSAGPVLANHLDKDDFIFGFGFNDDFGELGFDDQDLRSGDIDADTDISIDGNNNNQCVGLSQVNNAGNFANQQGTSNFSGGEDGNRFFPWWFGHHDRFDHDDDNG